MDVHPSLLEAAYQIAHSFPGALDSRKIMTLGRTKNH
jgi:hypothetical protein